MPGILGHGARARTRRMRPLQFAREIETPVGRRVVIATDQDLEFGERTPQYLGFGERTSRPPSEYAFTLLDIRFGPDGEGVGKLAPATMVVYNKETKTIEIENYGAQPVRLTEVRSEKP
jgi:hypothetical protein